MFEPLKMFYPKLYRIACITDNLVADFIRFWETSVQWKMNFTQLAQGWVLKALSSFFDLLYPVKPHNSKKHKMF